MPVGAGAEPATGMRRWFPRMSQRNGSGGVNREPDNVPPRAASSFRRDARRLSRCAGDTVCRER